MGDLTGEYFARRNFIKAVEWLQKYQDIKDMTVLKAWDEQMEKTIDIKKKITDLFVSNH